MHSFALFVFILQFKETLFISVYTPACMYIIVKCVFLPSLFSFLVLVFSCVFLCKCTDSNFKPESNSLYVLANKDDSYSESLLYKLYFIYKCKYSYKIKLFWNIWTESKAVLLMSCRSCRVVKFYQNNCFRFVKILLCSAFYFYT